MADYSVAKQEYDAIISRQQSSQSPEETLRKRIDLRLRQLLHIEEAIERHERSIQSLTTEKEQYEALIQQDQHAMLTLEGWDMSVQKNREMASTFTEARKEELKRNV